MTLEPPPEPDHRLMARSQRQPSDDLQLGERATFRLQGDVRTADLFWSNRRNARGARRSPPLSLRPQCPQLDYRGLELPEEFKGLIVV